MFTYFVNSSPQDPLCKHQCLRHCPNALQSRLSRQGSWTRHPSIGPPSLSLTSASSAPPNPTQLTHSTITPSFAIGTHPNIQLAPNVSIKREVSATLPLRGGPYTQPHWRSPSAHPHPHPLPPMRSTSRPRSLTGQSLLACKHFGMARRRVVRSCGNFNFN